MDTEPQTDQTTSIHAINGIPHDTDDPGGDCMLCALEREMKLPAATLNEIIALTRRLKRDTGELGEQQARLFQAAGVPKRKGFLYSVSILIAVMQEGQS